MLAEGVLAAIGNRDAKRGAAVAYAALVMCFVPYYLRVLSALLYIGMAQSLGDGRPDKVSAGKALAL